MGLQAHLIQSRQPSLCLRQELIGARAWERPGDTSRVILQLLGVARVARFLEDIFPGDLVDSKLLVIVAIHTISVVLGLVRCALRKELCGEDGGELRKVGACASLARAPHSRFTSSPSSADRDCWTTAAWADQGKPTRSEGTTSKTLREVPALERDFPATGHISKAMSSLTDRSKPKRRGLTIKINGNGAR